MWAKNTASISVCYIFDYSITIESLLHGFETICWSILSF